MRTDRLPPYTENDVLVESRFGAISRGTESLIFAGRVPESEYERMRGPFQVGDFPFPVKYGYAQVGEVVDGPARLVGQTVFCLHPHQDRFAVAADAVVPVPEDVPAERAVLGANMETALNILWDSGAMAGDRIAVVGGGLVGLLVVYLAARLPGTQTCVVDLDPGRASTAEALGVEFAAPGRAHGDCDVVIHASASAEGLASAMDLAAFEARIVEASWYGGGTTPVPLGGAFHSRRLSIVASQVGHVSATRRARWPLKRRLAKALALLADPRLDALFSGETAFTELAGRYSSILSDRSTLCHRITY